MIIIISVIFSFFEHFINLKFQTIILIFGFLIAECIQSNQIYLIETWFDRICYVNLRILWLGYDSTVELLTLFIIVHNGNDGVGTVINILIYNIEVAGVWCLLLITVIHIKPSNVWQMVNWILFSERPAIHTFYTIFMIWRKAADKIKQNHKVKLVFLMNGGSLIRTKFARVVYFRNLWFMASWYAIFNVHFNNIIT